MSDPILALKWFAGIVASLVVVVLARCIWPDSNRGCDADGP